jgi:hypothetical protein
MTLVIRTPDRGQHILLLSTKNLCRHAGRRLHRDSEPGGSASGGGFDFDVFGQTGPLALVLKDLFGSQLLSQCQLAPRSPTISTST